MVEYFYKKSTDVECGSVSNIIKQYLDIKLENLDALVFFRIGEFYETYFEDAFLLSEVCEVLLTKRDAQKDRIIPMAGIPAGSLGQYIQKLVANKHKVVLCEQASDVRDSKTGLVPRKVVRKYSPGTLLDSEFLSSDEHNFICAVLEEEGLFGLSYCDISTGEFFVTQGGLEDILFELSKISPSELLVPIKPRAIEPFKVVSEKEADIDEKITLCWDVTLVSRASFSVDAPEVIPGYELGSACANAILSYVFATQKEFAPKLQKTKSYDVYEYLLMDENTRKNLELVKNQYDGKKYGSLLWAIDHTVTPMGKRLLKHWLVAPLRNVEKIVERQDAIAELLEAPKALKDELKKCYDISRLCAKVSNNTAHAKDFLALRDTLCVLSELRELTNTFKSPLLNFLENNFLELEDFSNILNQTILDEPSPSLREGGLIKEGVDANLDHLRSQVRAEEKWLSDFEEREKKNIKSLKVTRNKIVGYFIEVPISKVPEVPQNYRIKQTLSNCACYTTIELRECEERLELLGLKANELEYDIFSKLREYAKELVESIREFSHLLAQLDVLCSLSACAKKYNFIKPKFSDEDVFKITKGRHPSVERLLGEYFPNDLDLGEARFVLLTGPNMMGKSTYLKQNAILAILSQMGSFVPADAVELLPVDKIFTRMGAVDNLVGNSSTFMVEMLEVADILKNATKKSLVLLDEVGKNTGTKDGVAIARAVSEYIIENIGAKTLFATHYHELSYLEEKYPAAKNYMIGACGTRLVKKGFMDKSFGVKIAKEAGLPPLVIERASEYSHN